MCFKINFSCTCVTQLHKTLYLVLHEFVINLYLQTLQTEFDKLQDLLEAERSGVTSLESQLEGEKKVLEQSQTRLSSLLEERENLLQSNGQLQTKIKVNKIRL